MGNLISVFLMLIVLFCPNCDIEQGWLGIKVFSATRIDLEKKLGTPVSDDGEVNYDTKDALIHVIFTADPCSGKPVIGQYNVPRDTVFSYRVFPKRIVKLSTFGWNKDRFERYEDPELLGIVYYSNRESGTRITSVKGRDGTETVESISFEISKEIASKYRCKPVQ